MFGDVIEWFKGMFGGGADELVDGASGALDQAGAGAEDLMGTAQEAGQSFGEGMVGEQFLQDSGLDAAAQDLQEGALGEVTETAQGFQEQAETWSGVAEDPMGAAADEIRGRLTGEG
ncbi:hypothetical protein [Nocardiopsis alba]|uniref:hypothetical protein n=1 Tax=Nocardiopsis alba TaxID=53437 RepID=UPI0035DB1085